MRMRTTTLLALSALLAAGLAGADEWDVGNDTDNAITTDNSLFHGAEQTHDLAAPAPGVADEDWYLVSNHRLSSYQVVVDGMTGDLDFGPSNVELMSDTGTFLQNGLVTDSGGQVTLNWTVGPPFDTYVRVRNAACGSSCTSQARYRIRFYDTTYTVPRFNNSGTQATVLLVLNASDRLCAVNYQFLRDDGTDIALSSISLAPAQLHVFPLATLPFLAGLSGSVRLIHTCGYGRLSGKAVSLEPSTGFTFETALVPRPH
jgi:hypothetical protein